MVQEEIGYRSFLLRMWCVKQDHELTWRASLENPRTGQQHFFSTQDALDEFLHQMGEELRGEMEKKDGL